MRTHTHTQCLHVHLWQTSDICEGSIQRSSRPATLGESLTSGKGWGSSVAPACPTFLSCPSPSSHIPRRRPPTKAPSAVSPHLGTKSPHCHSRRAQTVLTFFTPHALTWHPAGPLVSWKRNNSGRTMHLWATSGASVSHTLTARHLQHTLPASTHSTCINTLYLHQHTLDSQVHRVCVCVFVNTHCVSHLSACLPIIQMESLPAPEPFPKAFVIEDHCEHICWNVRSRCGPMTMCS